MDENLTSTYSYQGIAPKIPWNRPISKSEVKIRPNKGHPRGALEQIKDICNEENFTVWIDSQKRFGNCFYLTLFGYLPAILFTLTSVYFLAKPSYGFHHTI